MKKPAQFKRYLKHAPTFSETLSSLSTASHDDAGRVDLKNLKKLEKTLETTVKT